MSGNVYQIIRASKYPIIYIVDSMIKINSEGTRTLDETQPINILMDMIISP